MSGPAIVWLRGDLRLDDQPAIHAAADKPALFVFIYDQVTPDRRRLGGASRWWLARSLASLAETISALGGRLDILAGAEEELILALAGASGAREVFWTRRYGGAEIETDRLVKAALAKIDVAARSFNGQLLREPWEVVPHARASFKVFAPFWRRHRALGPLATPLPAPDRLSAAPWPDDAPPRVELPDLGLNPTKPDWSRGLAETWRPGEPGALARLDSFVSGALAAYPEARDRPDLPHTSRLSPHLRFGEISPRRIAARIEAAGAAGVVSATSAEKYLSELGWREFSYSLLYNFPDLASRPWLPRFENFDYREDEEGLRAWTRGRTGYPIVDAGMRELWATGYMHNRVRMIAASFLIKHLMIDWRSGEQWFWDTLCDADPANNPASWQWVAGSGADAAPFFRIFNPILQGQKFDPDGTYVRRWIPELAGLNAAHIHSPWLAPAGALACAGIALNRTYPSPIVDHRLARERALVAFGALRE
jgi:deoxyribodipyrimidine photo-lyase